MEERLKTLVHGNSETSRARWALEAKRQGRKVIGVSSCSYVPEEVVSAAGMLPWRITGTWKPETPHASFYRPINSCLYCTHALESLLSGELDFLDGVVLTTRDFEMVRLLDAWKDSGKTPFTYIIHIPHQETERGDRYCAQEITKLMGALEEFGGVKITKDRLRHEIDVYNQWRDLALKMYELRKREVPPISGAEALGIITTAGIMPKEDFNRELKGLLPYLGKKVTSSPSATRPRLLVSSDMLDNPAYLEAVEETGCLVAMDDLSTGSRYFWNKVDSNLDDPVLALGKHYTRGIRSPRSTSSWKEQAQQVVQWVKDYHINGVLELIQQYDWLRALRAPSFKRTLEEAGIPYSSFERTYHLSNVGQLKTRVGAFLEMI